MKSTQKRNDWQSLLRCFLGDDFFQEHSSSRRPVTPDTDIYVTKHEVIVVVDLPGVENIHELKMMCRNNKLVLSGKLTSPYQAYEQVSLERRRGSFRKEIDFPVPVTKRKYRTRYQKGVLELRFLRK